MESEEEIGSKVKKRLLGMVNENRQKAPRITPDVDIRRLIDDSQGSAYSVHTAFTSQQHMHF